MNRRFAGLALFLLVFTLSATAQKNNTKPTVQRIEPPFWFTGFKDTTVSIMVYGPKIASFPVELKASAGIALLKKESFDNANYVFLELSVGKQAKPSVVEFVFGSGKNTFVQKYELRARSTDPNRAMGFGPQDVIYLLVPDRFSNGDPKNDTVAGMLEAADRKHDMGRHGGDFKGIENKLDYIADLGMTAVWFTPVLENDMETQYRAYHGYAATDLYKVDRRFGSNEEYLALIDKSHKKGLKVIMDMIHNHVGDQHWWMKDRPTADWITSIEKHGVTNFRGEAASDPYASKLDESTLVKGWFVKAMPDLNTDNAYLADYLIQNSLWWIEYAGIDGIRMDTYVYPDKEYMARWVDAVHSEFPNFNIVGEVWVQTVPSTAYYTIDGFSRDGYKGTLRSVTDFPLYSAMTTAMWEDFGWSNGLSRVYYTLTQDFLYKDPRKNVIFLDNHDLWRFASHVNRDTKKYKIGLTMLLTLRGIPQVYYGTEIMLDASGPGNHDAVKRKDFPGGWAGDSVNKFVATGRTAQENEAFDFVKKLTTYRKSSPALQFGAMTHFVPGDNIYVYFRHTAEQEVMVVLNMDEKEKQLDLSRFSERLGAFSKGTDVLSGAELSDLKTLTVQGRSSMVVELKK